MSSPKSAMEPPGHGGPSSASDYGRLHRFPDPPPPPQARDTDALHGDAALARRREELLWEFHKVRIRQDMIFRELADIERAMVARFTPAGHWTLQVLQPSRDYCHCRPSSETSLGQMPLSLPSRCSEHPPSRCQSTQEVRPPPVYPYVERSPSPIAMRGYSEDRRSSSKQIPAEETLVPAVANAGIKPMRSALVREEVTPEHKDALVRERKADVDDGRGVQPLYASEKQSIGQTRDTKITTMVDQINESVHQSCSYRLGGQENRTFDQKRQEFSTPTPEQPRPSSDAKQQQECKTSGAREQPFSGYAEQCPTPMKQIPVEENLVIAAANGSTRPKRSVSLCHEVAPGHMRAVSGGPKVDVENGHGVQPLHEIKNQSSGQRKIEEPVMGGRMDKPLQPLRPRLTGLENTAYNEKKRIEFSERTPERTSGLKRRLSDATPPVKKPKPPEEWSCTLCDMDSSCQINLDEHLAGRLHQSNVEALRARNKSGERSSKASPGQWNKNLGKDGEPSSRDGKENLAEYCAGSRDQGEKPRGKGSVKDRLEPAPPRWTCGLCQVNCTTESDYYEHLRGRRHRENTDAISAEYRSESDRSDGDDGYTADWKRAYYCEVCDLQCNSDKMLASHLGGRRHREALEGRE
ncbi:hypothetical protein EJB05_43045 [Eragrostis curvula]|uniref:Matrin-type domain-containing protein n=1 Tax=Eragrostis curvula TaxID=38414 RepID=A0A5J9TE50_9POAL|nr:hypothetical protein EJB05_43045 [Eragrostis curvula]